MPLVAMASAVARTTCSFRPLQANLFQLFQPIGGVRATPLSRAWAAGRAVVTAKAAISREHSRIFMSAFFSSAVRQKLYIANGLRKLEHALAQNERMSRARADGAQLRASHTLRNDDEESFALLLCPDHGCSGIAAGGADHSTGHASAGNRSRRDGGAPCGGRLRDDAHSVAEDSGAAGFRALREDALHGDARGRDEAGLRFAAGEPGGTGRAGRRRKHLLAELR